MTPTPLAALHDPIARALVGQRELIAQTLVALAASGHVLIEGVPGLGKTLLVRALARALNLAHARIQFTPDMMPSDIIGHTMLAPEGAGGVGQLVVRCGAARSSRSCCWPTRSTARRPRRRARCSR